MKTQLIAITCKDGSLSIMHLLSDKTPRAARVDDEIRKAGIDAERWRLVSPEDLPRTRERRAHWRDIGHGPIVEG